MADVTLPEEWRPVPWFAGYEISNLGRVRHIVYLKGSKRGREETIVRLKDSGRGRRTTLTILMNEVFGNQTKSVEHETWLPVPGFPKHEISSLSRVRSIIIASCGSNQFGRKIAAFYSNGEVTNITVSRVVCEAFHGPPPTQNHVAAHWDGNHLNNHADNIRWATQSENLADKVRHGTSNRGSAHPNAQLNEMQIHDIRKLLASGLPQTEIGRRFGVSNKVIWKISSREKWGWLKS